jgi:hypothetical protein
MASTRAQQAQVIRNSAVLDQLAGSLMAAAYNVLNEATTTANHVNRTIFANAIMVNPLGQASFFVAGLMTNATLQGEAGNAPGASGTPFADSDIDFAVASLFNQYANQYVAMQNYGAALQLVP